MHQRLVSLVLLLTLWATCASAQVVFDANATADCVSGTGVTTATCATLTVGSGANRALTCQFLWDAAVTVTSVTWDNGGTNQAMALIVGATGTAGARHGELWALVAPTSGAKTLSMNWTTAAQVVINCESWTGVNQTGGTTSFPHGATATSTGSTSSVTVTSATNNAVIAAHVVPSNTFTAVSGTSSFIDNTPTNMSTAGNRAAGAASVALTGTISGSPTWLSVGGDIQAAGGAATPPTRTLLGVGKTVH